MLGIPCDADLPRARLDENPIAHVGVISLQPLNTQRLPHRLGVRADGPDFPVGRFVSIAVDVEETDRLYVDVARTDDLTFRRRLSDRRRRRRRIRSARDAEDIDEIDAGRHIRRGAWIESQATVGGGDGHCLDIEGVRGERRLVPIVHPLYIERVRTGDGWVTDGSSSHFVVAVGKREFPERARFEVNERIEPLVGIDAALARHVHVVGRQFES